MTPYAIVSHHDAIVFLRNTLAQAIGTAQEGRVTERTPRAQPEGENPARAPLPLRSDINL